MQHEKNIAEKALKSFKGLSLKVEMEELLKQNEDEAGSYYHYLKTRFYRDNHRSAYGKMEEIVKGDEKPLAQTSLQIVVSYLKTDRKLKHIIEDNKLNITKPTKPKGVNDRYTSEFIITRLF